MNGSASRRYTLFSGCFLLLQGISTLMFRLHPPLDAAFPALLEVTRMVPSHSILHILTALAAFWALWGAGPRGSFWFALVFGLLYVGLALVGWATGMHLGLGLQAFDHPFHLLLGLAGLVVAWLDRPRRVPARRE